MIFSVHNKIDKINFVSMQFEYNSSNSLFRIINRGDVVMRRFLGTIGRTVCRFFGDRDSVIQTTAVHPLENKLHLSQSALL